LALLLATGSQAQFSGCVGAVVGNLTAYDSNALIDLQGCFANTTFTYNPTSCALQSTAALYCSGAINCEKLMTLAIQLAYSNNCVQQVLQTLAQFSPSFCVAGGTPCSIPGTSCVVTNYTSGATACLPIIPGAGAACTQFGMPCTPCAAVGPGQSTYCTEDTQHNNTFACAVIVYRAADILVDLTNDAYFYLGQTYCQKYNGMYCADYLYAQPPANVTCDSLASWGGCLGSYKELADTCQNPGNSWVQGLYAKCPNATNWATKLAGVPASKCCGAAITTACSFNAGASAVPSLLLLAMLVLLSILA